MPKLILAAAALLIGRSPAGAAAEGYSAAQATMHDRTRSRVDTRRLRASGSRAARLDLGPLALTRRH
jgi:hypothetical protein